MTAERERALREALDGLRISYDPDAPRRLLVYHDLLCDWNTRVNLTGDADFDAALDRHYTDSLAPLALEGLFPVNAALADVGSGAGFPGLPLAVARPDLRVTLLDCRAKRVAFLNAAVKELGLANARVLHARAEDAGRDPGLRERFDVAAARAVAPLDVLCELLLPLVKVQGKMVCYKGPAAGDEWEAGNRAAALLGGGTLSVLPVSLPRQPEWRHTVFVSEKMEKTVPQYPRKAGDPSRFPLGQSGKT